MGAGKAAGFHDLNQWGYLTASLCAVGAIGGLASPDTARVGNSLGMMGIAAGVTSVLSEMDSSMIPQWAALTAAGCEATVVLIAMPFETEAWFGRPEAAVANYMQYGTSEVGVENGAATPGKENVHDGISGTLATKKTG